MLDPSLIAEVLSRALSRGAGFAEIFAEDSRQFNFNYLDRVPRRMTRGHDCGVGLRVFYGLRQVYAHASDPSRARLLELAEVVAAAGTSGVRPSVAAKLRGLAVGRLTAVDAPASSAETAEYLDFARRADEAARRTDPAVAQVSVAVTWTERELQIAASDGTNCRESRSYLLGRVEAIAAEGDRRQPGSERLASRTGLGEFRKLSPEEAGRRAAESAARMLRAPYAPAGRLPVVLGNAFGGVIFHEACGHGLETTSVAKGSSVFAGRLGQRVAAECVTAFDDGSIPGAWGSTALDDEGRPTQRTALIEKGVLRGYLVDRLGALQTGLAPTGSGRRESYRFAPASRMRNTFIAAGRDSLESMIASTDHGLYARKMGGGSVNPATGEFNFAVLEGYLIRKGKLAGPVRGASLIGLGQDVIARICMVGPDLELEVGTCGSISGWVPTTVGQPSLKVAEITVGGRSGP